MKFMIYILEKMTGREKKTLKDTQIFISGWLKITQDVLGPLKEVNIFDLALGAL